MYVKHVPKTRRLSLVSEMERSVVGESFVNLIIAMYTGCPEINLQQFNHGFYA